MCSYLPVSKGARTTQFAQQITIQISLTESIPHVSCVTVCLCSACLTTVLCIIDTILSGTSKYPLHIGVQASNLVALTAKVSVAKIETR